MTQSAAIFSQGSRTYATSSIFFPKHIREKVTILYAWVRTADNFVDSTPQDKKGFIEFRKASEAALRSKKTGNTVIDEFATLTHECAFEYAWIRSFLDAMEADLTKKQYSRWLVT